LNFEYLEFEFYFFTVVRLAAMTSFGCEGETIYHQTTVFHSYWYGLSSGKY
jgi:hypothetical protein